MTNDEEFIAEAYTFRLYRETPLEIRISFGLAHALGAATTVPSIVFF